MTCVIKIIGSCIGIPTSVDGKYLTKYDPDFRSGRGFVDGSDKIGDAIFFADKKEAMEFWKQPSKTHPIRSTDGKPNRPLTAYTVEIIEIVPA